MAGLSAAELDREIVIHTATASTDAVTKEQIQTFAAVDDQTVWAKWMPQSATEVWRARQGIEAQIEGAYVVYDMDPRPTPDGSRLTDEYGRSFDIVGVQEMGRGDGLMLMVRARGEGV